MKHKLLFSTALVAASMSFAAMANADDFYVDGKSRFFCSFS